MVYTVVSLTSEGSFSPAKWSGKTSTGRSVFFRYRWGKLTVCFDDRMSGEIILETQVHDDDSNPALSESELIEIVEREAPVEFAHREQ